MFTSVSYRKCHNLKTVYKNLVFAMSFLKLYCFQRMTVLGHYRMLSTSKIVFLDQRWRKRKGLPMNPNAYGVLTDTPDYTYLDGRPTPLGIRQEGRLMKRKEIAEKIINLTNEVDFAVERHKQLQVEDSQRKNNIIRNKLKPKGNLLKDF